MKNNKNECVLLSPDEYAHLMDEVSDARLLAIAAQRMGGYRPSKTISGVKLYSELGITRDALDSYDEVEIV